MNTNLAEAHLLAEIDLDRLPQHIAVIMDGNGRWAKRRHLPRIAGHRAGIRAGIRAVRQAGSLAIVRPFFFINCQVINYEWPGV